MNFDRAVKSFRQAFKAAVSLHELSDCFLGREGGKVNQMTCFLAKSAIVCVKSGIVFWK